MLPLQIMIGRIRLKPYKNINKISFREFNSLLPRHSPRLLSQTSSTEICQHCIVKRDLSTLESMYLKIVSLPAVHQIEDSLAYIHDFTGDYENTFN